MSTRILFIALAITLLAACGLAACGKDGGVCGEIYDKQKPCWDKEAKDDEDRRDIPSRDEFVAMCTAARGSRKDDVDTMAKCIKKGSCEEMDVCMREASEAEYAAEQAKELEDHIAAGKWSDAFSTCKYASDRFAKEPKLAAGCEKVFTDGLPKLVAAGGPGAEDIVSSCKYSEELVKASPAFQKLCGEIAAGAHEAARKAALAARDEGVDDFEKCYAYKGAAETVSEQAKKDAETVCAEMSAAAAAKAALTEAQAVIAAKKSELPYGCSRAAEALAKLDPKSEWATRTYDEVLKTCYLELGKVMIEVELPKLEYCPYQLTQLREAVVTYALAGKDPAFDALLAKTNKACKP